MLLERFFKSTQTLLQGGLLFSHQTGSGAFRRGANLTAGLNHDVPAAAAEHRSADPPPCREGVRFAVTRPPNAARLFSPLSPAPKKSEREQNSCPAQHGLERDSEPWIIHFVHLGEDDGGGNGLVFTEAS